MPSMLDSMLYSNGRYQAQLDVPGDIHGQRFIACTAADIRGQLSIACTAEDRLALAREAHFMIWNI